MGRLPNAASSARRRQADAIGKREESIARRDPADVAEQVIEQRNELWQEKRLDGLPASGVMLAPGIPVPSEAGQTHERVYRS